MTSKPELVDILKTMFEPPPHAAETAGWEEAGMADAKPVEASAIPKAVTRQLDVMHWLPVAARELAISADIRDYVVVPVTICPTDLPNRNCVAFPMEDLLRYNPAQGRPNFKTWTGKPTHIDHVNGEVAAAKGIIFDTYMKPIRNTLGNVHKLVGLGGFDRTKDPELARAILRGERIDYSMGARVGRYECACCHMDSRPGMINTECGHVERGRVRWFRHASGREMPAYYLARDLIEGFELSSVKKPAWAAARAETFFDMALAR